MKISIVLLSLIVPCAVSFSQEPQRHARPAQPAPEASSAQTPEWENLVEVLVTDCQGNLRCVVTKLQNVLSDPKASHASQAAAKQLMVRAQNALNAQAAAKEEPVRQRMDSDMREQLVRARLGSAQAHAERARAAARKEVEAGRLNEDGFRARMAEVEKAHKALSERLHRGVAPRNNGAAPAPRPTGGTRG